MAQLEIEAKMKLADPAALEARLAQCGAVRGSTTLECNTYFDWPDRAMQRRDEGLRLRIERDESSGQSRAIITHKGRRVSQTLKTRAETELEVADGERARELLAALGLAAKLSFEKRRRHWSLEGCSVELDTLPHLGDYVEIEGPSEERVLAVRRRLELDSLPLIRTSYIAMLAELVEQGSVLAGSLHFEARTSEADRSRRERPARPA